MIKIIFIYIMACHFSLFKHCHAERQYFVKNIAHHTMMETFKQSMFYRALVFVYIQLCL